MFSKKEKVIDSHSKIIKELCKHLEENEQTEIMTIDAGGDSINNIEFVQDDEYFKNLYEEDFLDFLLDHGLEVYDASDGHYLGESLMVYAKKKKNTLEIWVESQPKFNESREFQIPQDILNKLEPLREKLKILRVETNNHINGNFEIRQEDYTIFDNEELEVFKNVLHDYIEVMKKEHVKEENYWEFIWDDEESTFTVWYEEWGESSIRSEFKFKCKKA